MQGFILDSHNEVLALFTEIHRIAVLGIRSEACAQLPTYYVPSYMAGEGYEIVPVPVYEPKVTEILGQKVYRNLMDIPGEIDLVNVFRRPHDIPAHVPDILQKKPKAVWFQSGIRHDAVAAELAQAGIKVIQDRCLMVDHRSYKLHLA